MAITIHLIVTVYNWKIIHWLHVAGFIWYNLNIIFIKATIDLCLSWISINVVVWSNRNIGLLLFDRINFLKFIKQIIGEKLLLNIIFRLLIDILIIIKIKNRRRNVCTCWNIWKILITILILISEIWWIVCIF